MVSVLVPAARINPIEFEKFYGVDPTRFILYSLPGFALPHGAGIPARASRFATVWPVLSLCVHSSMVGVAQG